MALIQLFLSRKIFLKNNTLKCSIFHQSKGIYKIEIFANNEKNKGENKHENLLPSIRIKFEC